MSFSSYKNSNERSIFEAILARRSIRAYSQEEVKSEAVNTLLLSAVRAPTAIHEEPWAFVIVQGSQKLKQLSDLAKPYFIERLHRNHQTESRSLDTFNKPDFNIFHNAGTLIVICAKQTGDFAVADCWLAAENLMLVACSIGLGTCVIGSAVEALNNSKLKILAGIPAEYTAVAPIIVGTPEGETAATSRKEPLILCWTK